MSPLISIIVPVYNAEDCLENCVESILNQECQNFELLLIDDGSPDRSGEICDVYAVKDSRIRVFHKENGGVSMARNMGLEMARGEWVIFIDADDSIAPGFLNLLNDNTGYDLIIGGYKTLPKGEVFYDFDVTFHGDTMGEFVARHLWNGYVWGKFYKASILRDARIRFRTDLIVYEDLIFNLDYLLQCDSIRMVPFCLYLYKDPIDKMIQEKYALLPDEIKKIYALVEERLEKLSQRFHCWRPAYIFDFIELTKEYAIYEIPVPDAWLGKTISEINIRAKYKINIIAMKVNNDLKLLPGADYRFTNADHMVVIGKAADVFKLSDK